MQVDVLIKGGNVVFPSHVAQADLAIAEGRIAAVLTPGACVSAARVIDAAGKVVMPGAIDGHTHIGLVNEFAADMASETASAAYGGVTSVLSFLINRGAYHPEEAIRVVAERAAVDVGFHIALMTDEHLASIPDYMASGITTFKLFMAYKAHEGERLGILSADDGFLLRSLEQIAAAGAQALVHAENCDLIFPRYERFQGVPGPEGWAHARADFTEAEAIHRLASLSETAGATVQVVHVSSGLGAAEIRAARSRGVRIFGEGCPQYLMLACDDPAMPDPLGSKITPPVRFAADREALWSSVAEGTLRTVGTDHCSLLRRNKVGETIWKTRPGFPGLATMVPLVLTGGVCTGRVDLVAAARLLSTNPACFYGLFPRKGAIAVGADADLIVVDMERERPVRAAAIPGYSDFSPFEGMPLRGWPDFTICRGRVVLADGRLEDTSGGTYLHRALGQMPADPF